MVLVPPLREAATDAGAGPLGGENKVIETDETYVGGKAKNKAFGPPPKKMAVFALLEREGGVRSFHVTNVNSRTLRPIITKHASRKSRLMTDESPIYPRIGGEFAGHSSVNHSRDEHVRLGGASPPPTRSSPTSLSSSVACSTTSTT